MNIQISNKIKVIYPCAQTMISITQTIKKALQEAFENADAKLLNWYASIRIVEGVNIFSMISFSVLLR